MNNFLMQTIAFLKYFYLNWNKFIVNYLAISGRANSMHTHYRKEKKTDPSWVEKASVG